MNAVNLPVLNNISIASPCSMSWDEMSGDDRTRHCAHCDLNVYNLSGMTTAEAESLIRAKQGNLCVRYFKRADGTVLTQDCPLGLAAARAAFTRTITRIGAVAAALIAAVVVGRSRDEFGSPLSLTSQNPFSMVADLLGRPRPNQQLQLLGKVCIPRQTAPPPAPPSPSRPGG